jgi:hypothetical protein
MLFGAKAGNFVCSINITTWPGASSTLRYRLQAIDVGCVVLSSSAYSATYNTTGVKSDTLSLTWPAGAIRLRLVVETTKTVGVPSAGAITDNASSWVRCPF